MRLAASARLGKVVAAIRGIALSGTWMPGQMQPFVTRATSNRNAFGDTLRGPMRPLNTGQPFNRNVPAARYPHEMGYRATRKTAPGYSFGRPETPFWQIARPRSANLLNSLASVDVEPHLGGTMYMTKSSLQSQGSMRSAGSRSSSPTRSRPASALHPTYRPQITNFGNMHTPTSPTSYKPSYYPFPLGRHMWSTRNM